MTERRATCLVDGCKHTTSRYEGEWICAEHWRRYVPPRSRIRRTYHALHRKGERLGWPPDLRRDWFRLWAAIVRRVHRLSTDGHLDVAEINRVMGWD